MRTAYFQSIDREQAILARIPGGTWKSAKFSFDKALDLALRLFVR